MKQAQSGNFVFTPNYPCVESKNYGVNDYKPKHLKKKEKYERAFLVDDVPSKKILQPSVKTNFMDYGKFNKTHTVEYEDIKRFNKICEELNKLIKKIHLYNKDVHVNFSCTVDKDENDKCGLFLYDDSVYKNNTQVVNDQNEKEFKKYLIQGFAAGAMIDGAELYSRPVYAEFIKNYEDIERFLNMEN